jgi:NADPH-dependent F420 reductase
VGAASQRTEKSAAAGAGNSTTEVSMQIAILGAGNMARGLAALLDEAGYEIVLGARDQDKAKAAASAIGAKVKTNSIAGAASSADVVILAVPYGAAAETIQAAGDLTGKILIDISNPLTPDFMGLTVGHTTSAAEEIQRLAPNAKVVKAFNTLFARVLDNGGKIGGNPATVFLAGDDQEAVDTVAGIVKRMGLDVIKTGGLERARYLEPLGGLNVVLGYGQGFGTEIAPAWRRNS